MWKIREKQCDGPMCVVILFEKKIIIVYTTMWLKWLKNGIGNSKNMLEIKFVLL